MKCSGKISKHTAPCEDDVIYDYKNTYFFSGDDGGILYKNGKEYIRVSEFNYNSTSEISSVSGTFISKNKYINGTNARIVFIIK